jgi:hypothetical protein
MRVGIRPSTILFKCQALLVALALLLPTITSALPTPARSAEQQLIIDITQNVCSQDHSQNDQNQMPADMHKCCILCSPQALASSANSTPLDTPNYVLIRIERRLAISALPHAPPDLRATAPRGPPLNFST